MEGRCKKWLLPLEKKKQLLFSQVEQRIGFRRLMLQMCSAIYHYSQIREWRLWQNVGLGHLFSIHRVWCWTDYCMFDWCVLCPYSNFHASRVVLYVRGIREIMSRSQQKGFMTFSVCCRVWVLFLTSPYIYSTSGNQV